MLRLGVIGAGWIGQRHLENLAQMNGVTVAGVCDLDTRKAETLASRWGLPVFGDNREMMERAQLQAVVICTRPELPD